METTKMEVLKNLRRLIGNTLEDSQDDIICAFEDFEGELSEEVEVYFRSDYSGRRFDKSQKYDLMYVASKNHEYATSFEIGIYLEPDQENGSIKVIAAVETY